MDRPNANETLAFTGLEAHETAEHETFWTLQKAGLLVLLSRISDKKHISFIEDCGVPPDCLPEFVERFQSLLVEKGRNVDADLLRPRGAGRPARPPASEHESRR